MGSPTHRLLRQNRQETLSEQFRTHQQRPHSVGGLDSENRIVCRAFERGDGAAMQRTEFHPLDRIVVGEKLVGLTNGRDRQSIAVQPDFERRPQRGF